MKAKHSAQAHRLQDIPNIGPSIAADLRAIGIREPHQLVGQDPYDLYRRSNTVAGIRQDPCLIDCFISAVRFMEGAPPRPWWKYTPERKRTMPSSLRALALVVLCAIAAPLASTLAAQTNYDTVQVRATTLGRGVYMLTGAGGNIGLAVGDDAVFVVDDQFAPLTPKILAAIKSITDKPVKFVVNTHWHFDHTGGNENLGNAGGLIVAQENVRRRMSAGQFIEALNRTEPPAPKGALPVVTFDEGLTFHLNGDSLVVIHIPRAHTDGDAIVYFTRANVVHTGDSFVSAGLPFVDLSSGGSIHGVIDAAARVYGMTNDQTRIIPGHGPLTDRARLKAWRDMLLTLRDRMATELAAGRTLDQILALKITEPFAKDFPSGHDRFVRLLFQEMSKR